MTMNNSYKQTQNKSRSTIAHELPLFHFDRNICNNLKSAFEKEWLETNGIGGYASSTIVGINTRRYHGLLMAATEPPLGRALMLSKCEETLLVGEDQIPLSSNIYPDVVFPLGYLNQNSFSRFPFPTFTFEARNFLLEKTVFMVEGENTTVVMYRLINGPENVLLHIRPMIAFRDYHSLVQENPLEDAQFSIQENYLQIKPYEGHPPLYMYHDAFNIEDTGFWYRNAVYPKEARRGLDYYEDLYSPCALLFFMKRDETRFLISTTHKKEAINITSIIQEERDRRQKKLTLEENKFIQSLSYNAHSFIVKKNESIANIIAGYHWFADWGRDTMVSIPGICLTTGRYEDAKNIFLSYLKYRSMGMIPNKFPRENEIPEYNSVDASLWCINAIYLYWRLSGDSKTVTETLLPIIEEIISCYMKGTRYNIHMDSDGLLYAGEEGLQLTWMDVKIGEWVVTQRKGKPVEINALWYNALRIIALLFNANNQSKKAQHFETIAQKTKERFNEVFWYKEGRYLFDCLDGDFLDATLRPNQIFSISLPFTVLEKKYQESVFATVRDHLLTPYGLRTLSPHDKNYIGFYTGNQKERDLAYHQGTVWPWLLGAYIDAYFKIYGFSQKGTDYAIDLVKAFEGHIYEAGIGTISEIFDGDPPHAARGSISQAWSVAEILRVCALYITKTYPSDAYFPESRINDSVLTPEN